MVQGLQKPHQSAEAPALLTMEGLAAQDTVICSKVLA